MINSAKNILINTDNGTCREGATAEAAFAILDLANKNLESSENNFPLQYAEKDPVGTPCLRIRELIKRQFEQIAGNEISQDFFFGFYVGLGTLLEISKINDKLLVGLVGGEKAIDEGGEEMAMFDHASRWLIKDSCWKLIQSATQKFINLKITEPQKAKEQPQAQNTG